MKCEKVHFGDYVDIILGGTPTTTNAEFWNGDIPWASVVDFTDSKRIYNTEKTITELGLEKSNTKLLNTSDLILSARGTVGKVVVCGRSMAFNQSCYALRTKDAKNLNQDFLYYLTKTVVAQLKQQAVGGVFDTIIKKTIEEVYASIPPLPIQCRIASILSAYDDFIENNLKRMKLLEEKAFLMYKGIVKDEKMEKISVFDYAEIMSGGTPSTTNPNYWEGEIPFFTPKDLSSQAGYYLNDTERKITELGLEKCNSRLFPRDTIFITARGTVGKLVLAKIPSAISQSNYAITSRNGSSNYFLFLALIHKIDHFKQLAVGGVFDTIIVDTFKMIFLEFPSDEIIKQFNIEIKPIFQLIDTLQRQNTKLREARDILLPKLMNGQIEV